MKNLLLSLFLFLTTLSIGQTVIYNDNCETSGYNWFGFPINPQFPNVYSTYLGGVTATADGPSNKPLYVSTSNSFGLYGLGPSGSGSEFERYQLPNITGLNPSKIYRFSFKLMAYAENYTSFNGSGLDASDSVTVRVSVNNGPYVIESIIKGWTNSYWSFDASGTINETANGVPNVYRKTSGSGGDQENTGFGFSKYNLTLTNITDIQIRIDMRANYGGSNYGEWWVIDDMLLIEEVSLPIELYTFEGECIQNKNLITWSTASEHNNDYFIIERSADGENWSIINKTTGMGNSTMLTKYSCVDNTFGKRINYYRLTQVDFDGANKTYGPISIDNRSNKVVLRSVNLLGQEVDENEKGIIILIYEDGTMEKVFR